MSIGMKQRRTSYDSFFFFLYIFPVLKSPFDKCFDHAGFIPCDLFVTTAYGFSSIGIDINSIVEIDLH